MTISNQVLIITETVILPFTIKITHAIQVFNITKSIIDLLRLTTVSSIIVTHLDDILRITIAISNSMVIWTTVFAIIAAYFIEVEKVTFAIVNQKVGLAGWRRFPEVQEIDVLIVTDAQEEFLILQTLAKIVHFFSLGFTLTLSIDSLSQSQWCNRYHPKMTSS